MTLTGSRGATTIDDYPPTIRRIAERIGENPARFLDRDLVERGPNHTTTSGRELFLARVRAIDYIGVANAWIMVERELDRGPRDAVIDLLEQRRDHLIEHGERVELTPEELQERRAAIAAASEDEEAEPDPVWLHVKCETTDVERESSRSWFCNTCEQRTNRVEEVDPDDLQDADVDVAIADGGSP